MFASSIMPEFSLQASCGFPRIEHLDTQIGEVLLVACRDVKAMAEGGRSQQAIKDVEWPPLSCLVGAHERHTG